MSLSRRNLILAAVALAALAVVWLVPMDVTPDSRYNGKLFPATSWQVAVSGQGHLQSLLSERASGVVSQYALQTVERGEASEFQLADGLRAGSHVTQGDTIGTLRETGLDQRRTAMLSDVAVASREQVAAESGEKEALLREAGVRLDRTEALMALQERIVARTRQLHARALVSDNEMDTAETELATLSGDAAVIRAELDVLESGGRPADVNVARARLAAARMQLEAFDRRSAHTAIVSPISGVVVRSPTDSVLVSVMDTTAWVVLIPVPVEERDRFTAGLDVTVTVDRQAIPGTVTDIDARVQRIGASSVVLAVVAIDESPIAALDGLIVRVRIAHPPVRLRRFLTDIVRGWFSGQNWLGNAQRV